MTWMEKTCGYEGKIGKAKSETSGTKAPKNKGVTECGRHGATFRALRPPINNERGTGYFTFSYKNDGFFLLFIKSYALFNWSKSPARK